MKINTTFYSPKDSIQWKSVFAGLTTMLLMALVACAKTGVQREPSLLSPVYLGQMDGKNEAIIRYEYNKGELIQLCDRAISEATHRLDVVAQLAPKDRNFDNTVLSLEATLADFSDVTGPLTFMGYVSTNADIRKESEDCESKVGQFAVGIVTRKDLYTAIKGQKPRNSQEARLYTETLDSFEKNGLKLPEAKLEKVRELKKQLTALETEFSANLNNDKSTVTYTPEELEGLSESFLGRLKKDENGNYIATTKSTDYVQVMQSAVKEETRRKMLLAYTNRAGSANTELLEKAILLREKIATLMGYKTWADYKISSQMAKSAKSVHHFLRSLQGKLSKKNKADLDQLLAYKKELDPQAKQVEMWDINYLTYQLKKRDYSLDDDKIREYFPLETVTVGMFEVYSQILNVRFEQVTDADVWAPDVRLYKIFDKKTSELIAYFFTDFTPREGKYGHAAAFTLIQGRLLNHHYNIPVSSIVANFNPPANGRPSLLNHDEVETLFHEFGHIMHQTLTRAPYASLSGTSVRRDFVEAPSQMLENWVWQESILNKISGHYKNSSEKLPQDILKKMLEAKDFNQGYFYTRQLFLGLFDYTIHTQKGVVDTVKVHDQLYKSILGIDPLSGNRFAAGFGHMMGGYDAGYYGYLWSEVYAQDMFTQFENGKLLDPAVGMKYRKTILESGNMMDPMGLLKQFLGREPNQEAFFRKLGI